MFEFTSLQAELPSAGRAVHMSYVALLTSAVVFVVVFEDTPAQSMAAQVTAMTLASDLVC